MLNITRTFRQFTPLSLDKARSFSNSEYRRQNHNDYNEQDAPKSKKPIGGFRGGLIGFLLGVTLASGAGYVYLMDDYHAASNLLLSSVEELQLSTNKVRDYAKKIEKVEGDLRSLQTHVTTKDQLSELRKEMKRLYDTLEGKQLELKVRMSNLEKDILILESKH
ncbi:1859_t:CDS:2 [Ambispora gerdemannii]|uniref:1859_t:CDS:1 n=1 Tax=Ambispora gerdemannii TaxID=144530 RepID=A0A9N8Z4R0_9GLOM|nr:1859_t:CDS:2 [Ambispora gerdemannii]